MPTAWGEIVSISLDVGLSLDPCVLGLVSQILVNLLKLPENLILKSRF